MLAPVVSVIELRHVVCAAASGFDASRLDGAGAAEAVREWAAIAHAADAAMALAAARLSACELPTGFGACDASDLVAKTTGVTTARAKETISRGAGLAVQEATRAAATGGLLSPQQASVITDAVTVNPDAEAELVAAAGRSSVGELRQQCAQRKAEKLDLAEVERRIHTRRCVRRWRDPDGAEHLHASGTKRDMAIVDQALKQLVDGRFKAAHAAGEREPLEAYGFDALVALATRFLDGTGTGAKQDPIRNLTLLRVDLAALVRGQVEAGERCEIAGLGPIAVATARAMLGESVLKLVLTNGVEVRNVTHLGRGPNTAQKVALLWEQPTCLREGCGRRARLESDHVDGYEYRKTKRTRLDELGHLCDPDHDLKTLHGWALVDGTGVRPMVPPDDPRHPRYKQGRGP